MATTWYAQTAGGNWSSGVMWNDAAGGGGSFGTPGNGDTCHLNGKTVVADITTIPASGTLAELTATGGAGVLSVVLSGSTTYTLNAALITGGTALRTVVTSGSAPSSTCVINGNAVSGNVNSTRVISHESTGVMNYNGNITAGSGTSSAGLYVTSTGTVNLVGNIVGGGGTTSHGALVSSTGTLNITGNVTASSGSTSLGVIATAAGFITVNGTVTGGSFGTTPANGAAGIRMDAGTLTINGTVVGGSNTFAYGVLKNNASPTITVNGNLVDSATTSAVVGGILYNPTSGNYSQHVATGGGTFKQYREDAFVSAANVLSGQTFWVNGASSAGTANVDALANAPSESQVLDGVQFGSVLQFTGNVTQPLEAQVIDGVDYGSNGTQYTGNVTEPLQSDVRDGIGYGANGNQYEGTLGGGVVTITID